jgi:hypothetical protein
MKTIRRARPAGALNSLRDPEPRQDLAELSLVDLTAEIVARLARVETLPRENSRDFGTALTAGESKLGPQVARHQQFRKFTL